MMYYVFDEKGAILDQHHNLSVLPDINKLKEQGLTCIYYTGASQNAREHGIEVLAPSSPDKEFIAWIRFNCEPWTDLGAREHTTDEFSLSFLTFEKALEAVASWAETHEAKEIIAYGIEERITITHKVKL